MKQVDDPKVVRFMPERARYPFLLLAVISMLGYGSSGIACPSAPEKLTPEMFQSSIRNARDRGFLWRIDKDGRSSYLYGTLHIAKPEWMVPGPVTRKALDETDTLALEMDLLDPSIEKSMADGIAKLSSIDISEALIKRIRQQAESECVPYDAIAKLPPELQLLTLSLMNGRWDGLDVAYGIDLVLASVGRAANKNVVSLETPELQLKMLQMKNRRETEAFVENELNELETGHSRKMLNKLTQVWASADANEMEHFSEWCECLNTELRREIMKRTLDERNPNLADHVDALHGGGKRVFVAVGSLHMFGPLGLPTLMGKRGYRVERIELVTH